MRIIFAWRTDFPRLFGRVSMPDQPYQRHHTAVCGDAALGIFMQHLSRFLAGATCPARFVDDAGVERDGIARTWDQWAEELGLTRKQFRRVLEKATALSYVVRARRTWGTYRVIRLHVAITNAYVDELTRCVALGATAYLKATRAVRRHDPEGHNDIAQMGNTNLPTEGNTMLPTEGNYKEDSSNTPEETLSKTAVAADADDARASIPGKSSPEAEKIMTQPVIEAGEEERHTATATSQGLATKLSALGLLAEWQRSCAAHGVSVAESVTDEQVDGLAGWCAKSGSSRSQQEECIEGLVGNWAEFASALCNSDEGREQHWQAPEKPCLNFVRQVADCLTPGYKNREALLLDKPNDTVQAIAQHGPVL
jgi:hypothetical protein